MEKALLARDHPDETQVTGRLTCETLMVETLEKLSTLIKEGTYICKYTKSARLSALAISNWLKKNSDKTADDAPEEVKNYFTYEITGVEGRSGIRIHSCNYSYLLEGCIAPGHAYSDLNKDGEVDILNSKQAVLEIEDFFNRRDFELTIV